MQQLINITDARNNLSRLVQNVAQNQTSVVIIRDSQPEAILMPYKKIFEEQTLKEKSWQNRMKKLLNEGETYGQKYLKSKGLDIKSLSEQKLYDLLDEN